MNLLIESSSSGIKEASDLLHSGSTTTTTITITTNTNTNTIIKVN